jgi:hypothetical protein
MRSQLRIDVEQTNVRDSQCMGAHFSSHPLNDEYMGAAIRTVTGPPAIRKMKNALDKLFAAHRRKMRRPPSMSEQESTVAISAGQLSGRLLIAF